MIEIYPILNENDLWRVKISYPFIFFPFLFTTYVWATPMSI